MVSSYLWTLCCINIVIICCDTLYYFNPSPLSWNNANKFCHLHCNSTLAKIRNNNTEIHVSNAVFSVYENTAGSNWTMALTLGATANLYEGEHIDIGQQLFNKYFHESQYKIIRRECKDCDCTSANCVSTDDNKFIYYKRLTNRTTFDAYSTMKSWVSTNNILGIDFNLYSTLEDALHETNAWSYCNYDDPPGAFRDCGINNVVPDEWTSDNAGDSARFAIYTPNLKGIWIGNKDQNGNCLQLDLMNNTRADLCHRKKSFMCDSCAWNVLSKYVISEALLNYSDAQSFCQTQYGTYLAEIQSNSDMKEAALLCDLYNDTNCWISPRYDPVLLDNNHSNIHRIMDNGYAAKLSTSIANNSNINDLYPTICNQRNELCDPSQWNVLDGIWNWSECSINSTFITHNSTQSIKLNRFRDYEWNSVVVEYKFVITDLAGIVHRAGLTLNFNDKEPLYTLFVGVSLQNNKAKVFMLNRKWFESKLVNSTTDEYELDMIYTLKVTLSNYGVITVYLNDEQYFWSDLNYGSYVERWLPPINFFIDSIKLRNTGMSTYSKSVYIHGDKSPDFPTMDPTMDPTKEPTINPTISPSDTTLHPTANPTMLPSVSPIIYMSNNPTEYPTKYPTTKPSTNPTSFPTYNPTFNPTLIPTLRPTSDPTSRPTADPTLGPTSDPTLRPTSDPSLSPTFNATFNPSSNPTLNPIDDPTIKPTLNPSFIPTLTVSQTHILTTKATLEPTSDPTVSLISTITSMSAMEAITSSTPNATSISRSVETTLVSRSELHDVTNMNNKEDTGQILLSVLGCIGFCCIGIIIGASTYARHKKKQVYTRNMEQYIANGNVQITTTPASRQTDATPGSQQDGLTSLFMITS